ncbi:AMP-binding protein [Bradyrhizobium sp. BWA-3-5]|uniref:AMP-binding protein n=1 Tax=Bradyrhizobium sp. BWA-3-5 TaxID=3080013 RepID=UPI00293F75AA|nr:AMP-binding protein [Bradyrhizobium sp. BWA-3-5]WOH63594.1 AMP-binding protein [Bradyrhizobium sp. BWA-3-5]
MSKIVKKLQHKAGHNSARLPSFACLPDLLSYYAGNAPHRRAILAPGCLPMTYDALWSQTREVVRGLRSLGVGRTDRVAVVLPDGPEAAVAMIALAAGAVCVPLNPGFTYDEYQRYFGELRLAALLTNAHSNSPSRRAAQASGIPVIEVVPRLHEGAGAFSIVGQASRRAKADEFASGADDAFILLTSGSTSRPKTVPLTHASVCLSARNVGTAIELGARDRLLSVLPLFHGHGLISGLLAALAAGSSVVSTSGFDARGFFGWLTEFRPTWYTAVPAIHQAILREADLQKKRARRSSLRLVRSASTSLAHDVLGGLQALFGVPVIDTYGMTEAATQIAANSLQRQKPGSVGRPAGPEVAILDSEGRRLRSGRRGEIALRGATITRGYDNDAAATASAFRGDWFRTGDLGYLDAEGYLFIVGRIKEIIHKGGQKVAPAEVEGALLSHPDVIDAAVFSVPHGRLGADVAAAVVLRQDAKVSAQRLRDFARERLAGFKVPGLIRIVPEIPKGGGGKIKRGELAVAFSKAPPATDKRGDKTVSPGSELQHQLAGIWAELLDIDQVGVDEDVFALGVDSLAMTQMILRLEERFGVDFAFEDIFSAPTVAGLALRVESSKRYSTNSEMNSSDPTIETVGAKGDGPQPVSIVQERMLRIERKLPGLPQFNLPFAYRLQGPLNVPALKRALADVARRHASLRTAFAWQEEVPLARVMPDVDVASILTVKDLAPRTRARNARIKELLLTKAKLEAEQVSLKPIDMSHAPLFRAHLFRLDAEDHVLLLVVHDIIIDGWSMVIFMEDLSELYSAAIAGRKAQLPEPKFQFSEFAHWQRVWSTGPAANRQFAYWKGRMDKVSPLFATPKISIGGELISRVIQEPFQMSNDLVARLRCLSHSRGVTLFMTLLAGFKTLLLLRTARTDFCVATLMANRAQLRRERIIGPFANTALIRTRIDADLTFGEALNRVREAVWEAYARQELPFDIIAARLAEEAGLSPASLVQIYFILQVAFRRPPKLPDVTVSPFGYQEGRTAMPIDRAWLSMALKESSSGITGLCGYKSDLFEPNTAQDWIADYTAILAKAAAYPDKELGRLPDFE